MRGIFDRGLGFEHLGHSSGGGQRARCLCDQRTGQPQGLDQHEDVGVERDQLAELQVTVGDLVPAVPEDDGKRQRRKEVEHGQEAGSQARALERSRQDTVGLVLELPHLELFGPESLDRPHARHALLDDRREIAELALLLRADGCRAMQ